MSLRNRQLLPPSTWQEFEKMCHITWQNILGDNEIQLNGRQGQDQAGVDVFGTHKFTKERYGIQCKGKNSNYGSKVTTTELLKEVNKAKEFTPTLDVFILATTAPNDQAIQKEARLITEKHEKEGLFNVHVLGWDEICQRICSYPDIIEEYYPNTISQDATRNIEAIKSLLETNLLNIHLQQPNNNTPIFNSKNEAVKLFFSASQNLLNWRQTLTVDNTWINREEEDELLLKLENDYHSTSILLGAPGSGKSALLSRLSHKLVERGEMVLAIKADHLNSNVTCFSTLSEALGLPTNIDKMLIEASKFGNVILILDQLDTLSELIDVKTQRLSVLLNLIRTLSNQPNIHILASSRPFEFEYDQRFRSINAAKIILINIEWDVIQAILDKDNISLKNINENFKAFLTRPSNLNFYLNYLQDNPQKLFLSTIELYEDIWSKSLGAGDVKIRRANFLMSIASEMTENAKQILPLLRYENHREDIEWLTHAGILVISQNNKHFTFTHQTLQAFAWTRSFIYQNNSLYEFILSHQHNLNIRPKLTIIYQYLRETDPEEYKKQITLLLRDNLDKLTLHIRYLLIDCISKQNEPTQEEIAIFNNLLSTQDHKAKICKSILGQVAWFDLFKETHIPAFMESGWEDSFLARNILASVINISRKEVISLINTYWKSQDKISEIYFTIWKNANWDDDCIDLTMYLAEQDTSGHFVTPQICNDISKYNLKGAIKVAAHHFNTKLQQLIALHNTSAEYQETELNNRGEPQSENKKRDSYESLLTFDSSWYWLPETIERESEFFIKAFWPLFEHVCRNTISPYQYNHNTYKFCEGYWHDLMEDDRGLSGQYFSNALEIAIVGFTKANPKEFISFYKKIKKIEIAQIHRLIAKGLEGLAETNAEVGLSYLLEDDRRFRLGKRFDYNYRTSLSLVEVIAINLPTEKKVTLEKAILSFKDEEISTLETAEEKQDTTKANRIKVSKLLSAIPYELLSPTTQKYLREEERAFNRDFKVEKRIRSVLSAAASSPLSIEQMVKASKEDIIKLLIKFPDSRTLGFPSDDDKPYSSVELARVFGSFAKDHPHRAKEIMISLSNDHSYAVGFALEAFAKASMGLKFILDAIEELEKRNIISFSIRQDAAKAIKDTVTEADPLPDIWCEKLASWLEVHDAKKDDIEGNEADPEPKKIESILWDRYKMYSVPNGNFSILQAITYGYLTREQPDYKSWCKAIKEHIPKKDDISIWETLFIFHFRYAFNNCEESDAVEIIDLLLEYYPNIISSDAFAFTIAQAIHWVSTNKFYEWLEVINRYKTDKASQTSGELLGLKLAIHQDCEKTKDIIESHIESGSNLYLLYGLGFAFKNIWNDRRPLCANYLVKLINLKIIELSYIALGVIRERRELTTSHELNLLLDALLENDTLLVDKKLCEHLASPLSNIVSEEPQRVSKLSAQLISVINNELRDVSSGHVLDSSDLTTIALTLHNMGPEFQETGLKIFENLLKLDAHEVDNVIEKLDDIPKAYYKA